MFDDVSKIEIKIDVFGKEVKIVLFYFLMPYPFTGPKMFWAGPNFLCQTKR